jgi:hypothetical protein
MRTLRFALVLALPLLGSFLIAPAALAGNPHFVTASGSIQGNSVQVGFTEGGLGNQGSVHEELAIQVACENGGGNDASTQTVVAAADFPVLDGQAEGSLTATAPPCPAGQTLEVYHDYSVTDTTNNVTVYLRGFVAR